jgi:type I restriction enzyme, S subunit
MNEWQEATLGELLTVKHGFAFKGEFFRDEGDLVVLTPGNFNDKGGFKPKSGKEKYYAGPYPPEYLLNKGDVVVAMTEQAHGLLGSTATIPSSNRYLHNQRLGLFRVRDDRRCDLRFCYHLMNAPTTRQQVQVTATGTKVRHTAPVRIQAIRVKLPDLATQRTIASILDAIDDLIGNSRRRIELLEQMAQAIYREWFVHFRYPGHEGNNLVDSPLGPVPDGWDVVRIGEVLEFRYGKALKKADRKGGSVAVVGSSGIVGWHDEELISGPAIVIGRKGNVGSVTWISESCWPIDTTYYVLTNLPLRYVYEQLDRAEFINSHAAVPGLGRGQAYSLPFLLPKAELMEAFEGISEVLRSGREVLLRQITSLTVIRDLLLPKLVTGQIDVSKLDLDALVGAAG